MAFDGITIAAMVSELNKNLSGGRITRLPSQKAMSCSSPERGKWSEASASLRQCLPPLIYFTGKNRISPFDCT